VTDKQARSSLCLPRYTLCPEIPLRVKILITSRCRGNFFSLAGFLFREGDSSLASQVGGNGQSILLSSDTAIALGCIQGRSSLQFIDHSFRLCVFRFGQAKPADHL